MDSFCTNCGTPIPEGAVKCASCGKEFSQEPQPVQEQPAQEQQTNQEQPAQAPNNTPEKKIKKSMLYGIIGAAAAVLIILIIIIASVAGNSYKKAIDNYMDVLVYGKANKIEKLAPKEYWDYCEENYDTDINDVVDQFEDSYEYLSDSLEEEYGIAKKSVTKAYEIEAEVTFKGSDDEDTEDMTLIVVKIGGSWYICSESGDLFLDSIV